MGHTAASAVDQRQCLLAPTPASRSLLVRASAAWRGLQELVQSTRQRDALRADLRGWPGLRTTPNAHREAQAVYAKLLVP